MPRKKRELPWLEDRDGVYYAHWYDAERRRTERLSLRTSDAREAQLRFAEFLIQGPAVYAGGAAQGGPLIGKLIDDYIREHVDEGDVVAKDRLRQIAVHLKAHFGQMTPGQVDVKECRSYVAKRRSGEIGGLTRTGGTRRGKGGTIRKELSMLGTVFRHAVLWKRITLADVPKLEMPKGSRPREAYFTREELRKLRDTATGRTKDFIDIAYYTGGRAESVLQLKWSQIDMKRMRIDLRYDDERAGVRPETCKRRPIIAIDPELLPILQRLREQADSLYVLGHPGSIRTAFNTACRQAGLATLPAQDMRPEIKPTPHTLRHSRATHMLQDGKTPMAVATLLGDSVQTIIKTYGHHCPDYLADALGITTEELTG